MSIKNFDILYNRNDKTNKQLIKEFKEYTGYNERKIKSIGIYKDNMRFIEIMQDKAKQNNEFISSDVIINIALYSLFNDYKNIRLSFYDWLRCYI